ncbi:general stress protein [Actinoplanes sp. NPDC049316]|uniref:general stress protein n=1 Tax=Actinoplanes sp. NPDC049316 TaxID=3154727 RepID=UPI0034174A67
MNATATLLHSVDRTDVYRLGEFTTYHEAERMVDRLSDAGFPVERARIVGTGLHSVEQVAGRLTGGRAALFGAALGAWLGMLTGLVLGLFLPVAWLPTLLTGLVTGAAAGAALGFVTHWATDGRRDFASTTALRARRYAVEVAGTHAPQALRALERG